MAEIAHEIKINAPRTDVFAALSTRVGMQGWHTTDVSGDGSVGSVWHLGFGEGPTFEWEVTASEPDVRVHWLCLDGPGDSAGTTVEYRLSDTDDGRTLVEQLHAGWPHEEGAFRKCNTLWGVLLTHLQNYAETAVSHPAYS